jgi:hypothetical protein
MSTRHQDRGSEQNPPDHENDTMLRMLRAAPVFRIAGAPGFEEILLLVSDPLRDDHAQYVNQRLWSENPQPVGYHGSNRELE